MATRQEDAIITANELSRLFGSPAFFAGRARDTPRRSTGRCGKINPVCLVVVDVVDVGTRCGCGV